MDDFSGQVVKGYELRERIGAGGSGAVYRAFQSLVGRDVAIKIILPQYANHPDFIRRFENEAQLVARLEHPHIVPLYDYWREPGGAYLVMRWLKGGNLQQATDNQPLSLEALGHVFEQILPALAVAHRHGVVHRDLKPANILLDDENNAYLADFGIAKDLGNRNTAYQTQTGVLGSPAYLSPEQIYAKPVTPQTDIYSLGVLMFEALAGELPFQETSLVALLYKHMNEPMPSVRARRPDLPEAIDLIIQRASAKNPADRYNDVQALLADIRAITHSGSTALLPPLEVGGSVRSTPTDRRRRTSGVVRHETGFETMVLDLGGMLVENPYKGLRAFSEADAADFFGREVLTQHLLNKIAEPGPMARFLAVVGPSGSGKSSVVRAGVVPALRKGALPNSDRWFIVEMLPGANPLVELEAALMRVAINPPTDLLQQLNADDDGGLLRVVKQILPPEEDTELLLVIDQFEEVFTQVEDPQVRDRLINGIFRAVTTPYSRLRVIVTLRADFYDRPLLYPQVSELFRQRTEVVIPLNSEELERAIVQPAAQVGLILEAELIAAIVHDVGEQPGTLPLLQYALTELVERRTGRVLTLASYRDSGGVLGALARRADELYEQLSPEEQEVARQLFLRLVTLGEGTEDTRRRVQQTELASIAGGGALLDGVVSAYNKYRLLSFDRDPVTRSPTVEVAHEALIRTWTRLREWLDTSREDVRLQRRLASAAAEWTASKRDSSFLASGARLEQFGEWSQTSQMALNADERTYLEASLAERDAQLLVEEARKARELNLERKSRRIFRALAVVLLVSTIGALGLAGFAFGQRRIAQENAVAAEDAKAEAQHQADLAKQNENVAVDAKAEAENQAQIARSNAAEAQNVALTSGAQAAFSRGNSDLALALATVANQNTTVSSDEQSILATAAYAPGTRFAMSGHEGEVLSVDVSRDGKTAVSGGRDKLIILWDLTTGKEIKKLEGHEDVVANVAFSPDGTTVASASNDETVRLWDVATGKETRKLAGHEGDVKAVAWSPDGKTVVSGSVDKTLILWDAATGQKIRTFSGHTQGVLAVAFSPDGQQIVSGSSDTSLIIWNVAAGAPIRTLTGHAMAVNSVAWSPDGKTILSGSTDTNLILWDAATGAIIRTLVGHTRDVWSVAYSPDGKQAVSASREGRIGVWDLTTGQLLRFMLGHGADVQSVKYLPTGKNIVSASFDHTVRLWNMTNGAIENVLLGHSLRVNRVTLSPDGKFLLSGSGDSTMILWDAATGKNLFQFAGHNDAIGTISWSPDGKLAVTGAGPKDGTLIIWDIEQRQVLKVLNGDHTGHTKEVSASAFSPDGKTILSGSGDDELNLTLWDVASGQIIRSFKGHKGKVNSVAFSPDGKTALSASRDKLLILWDVATGKQLRSFEGHTANVRVVNFSPDGKRALSGSDDTHIILWDVATGEPIRTFVGHSASLWDVEWSPDGKLALSASDDLSMILWDVETGAPIRRYDEHKASVRSVAWSPDGKTAFSGSNDLSIIKWRIDTLPELVAWAQANRYSAPLTCDQDKQYKLDRPCADAAGATK